jgi:phage-related protein
MVLLLGALTALLAELIKWAVKKGANKQFIGWVVLSLVFVISLVLAILQYAGKITPEMINATLAIFAAAVATYEAIIKRISPLIVKLFDLDLYNDEPK